MTNTGECSPTVFVSQIREPNHLTPLDWYDRARFQAPSDNFQIFSYSSLSHSVYLAIFSLPFSRSFLRMAGPRCEYAIDYCRFLRYTLIVSICISSLRIEWKENKSCDLGKLFCIQQYRYKKTRLPSTHKPKTDSELIFHCCRCPDLL